MQTVFVYDNLKPTIEAVGSGGLGAHLMYGGYHLFKENLVSLCDIKEARKIKESNVVVIVPMHAMKLNKRGNKTFLINLNSNHIIARNQGRLQKWFLRKIFNSCHKIICMDKSQIKPLKDLGVTSKLVVNPLMIDTIDIDLAIERYLYSFNRRSPYYLSAGFDVGRNFNIIGELKNNTPIMTLGRHCVVKYTRYCEFLAGCSGMILNIINGPGSSDISGNTVVLESLCAHKPVFINPQSWLKNINSKNIHIYNNKEELEILLANEIVWKDEKIRFDFDIYLKKLKKIIK